MNLCSMFAEAGHVWYLCIISNSSNAYANFYDEKNIIMSRAATSAPTCCHVNAHRTPTSPTRVNLRAQHVSTYEPNTFQSKSPTRVNLPAVHVSTLWPYTCTLQAGWNSSVTGENRHGCNDIYDKIQKIVKVQQLWRYKDDEDDFIIASSQIYVHDVFGLYYDKSGLSWMWTFLVVRARTFHKQRRLRFV